MRLDLSKMTWTNKPKYYTIDGGEVTIDTEPHTDLWQRTYYHFRNDNAPMLQYTTDEEYFTFEVKTEYDSRHRFEQTGVVMYLDSDNWIKASVEYDNTNTAGLGVVVTNDGFSDWSSTDIPEYIKCMWYRLSRRGMDFKIENSLNGVEYKQMRICHMNNAKGSVNFGIYACSPEDSSFVAKFSDMSIGECEWQAHDGQQPDTDIDY